MLHSSTREVRICSVPYPFSQPQPIPQASSFRDGIFVAFSFAGPRICLIPVFPALPRQAEEKERTNCSCYRSSTPTRKKTARTLSPASISGIEEVRSETGERERTPRYQDFLILDRQFPPFSFYHTRLIPDALGCANPLSCLPRSHASSQPPAFRRSPFLQGLHNFLGSG